MTQSSSDNVYVSLTFGNIPRAVAEEIVADAEDTAKGYDMSVDYGTPIGYDDPTPVADEVAAETGGDPTAEDPSDPDTDNLPPVLPPAEPTPTVDETPLTVDNNSGITLVTVDPNTPDQASER